MNALGRCVLCGLDHEWAPDWSTEGCPMPVLPHQTPQERTTATMKALVVASGKDAFEAFLKAQLEAAREP